jgi:hypothetical protein
MRFRTRMMLAVCLFAPLASQAAMVWSTCQTITSVGDYQAYNSSIIFTLSPGIPGCGTGGVSLSIFLQGTNGVTSTNINSFLATGLAAATSGKGVTIFYDNSTASCYGQIISFGGASNLLCP